MKKKQFEHGSRWMALGASPSAPEFCDIDVDYVAAGGPGIELRMPDVYLIAERSEMFKWFDYTLDMQAQGGHLLVTSFISNFYKTISPPEPDMRLSPWPDRIPKELCPYPGPYPVDEIIEVSERPRASWSEYRDWNPGELCMSTCGTMGLLYAIREHASEIHMVGLEGYSGKNDYFDNDRFPSTRGGRQHFEQFTLPFIHKIVKSCPDTKFFHYGQPKFALDYPNVSRVSSCLVC